ncbi:hypothetical protein F441_18305 [Phytophthora nicotianae CJ01A1]|uniref:Condensation domain-containing protein n=2 Tax=Phytophthora nicotianae TaxID=4792 RepID=W2I3R0_PHYNI|nr:hypothetical protein L915_17931 [Phytophthora nicotianae]ETL28879.1 hypothetical protein L916_17828 [Phytophthora nicotianae]ETP05007.1 hypothetical protein F441_18305 [Phytophthora nicotianae CJ01A1]
MVSSSTVTATAQFPLQCADESSLQSLQSPVLFGPLDQHSLLAIPLAVVFVYRPNESAVEELIPIDRLRRALERLLDYYPHLTGRIVIDPKDKSPRIEQLGAGARLVSAQCGEPLKSFEYIVDDDQPGASPRLVVTNLPDGGNALLPEFDPTEAGAARDAILTVQHTRFACGGVSIALRLRHIVCDAAGFFQLARDLAHLYRGLRALDQGQSIDELSIPSPGIHSLHSDLQMSVEERQEALAINSTLFELATDVQPRADNSPAPEPVIGRVLRFSSNELARIKADANVHNDKPVSTFCALAAYLWKSIYRARVQQCRIQGMSSDEAALKVPRQFLASLDLRSRGQLDISSRYFPNCVLCPVFSLSAGELLDSPLPIIAAAVRDGVQPLDPSEVQQNLTWLAAQPDKDRVRLRYQGGVMVSQWNKFGMYTHTELDVPPALVGQPFTPISLIDGLIYFMATEDQLNQCTGVTSGSIDVSMALNESAWGILDQDVAFRQHRE